MEANRQLQPRALVEVPGRSDFPCIMEEGLGKQGCSCGNLPCLPKRAGGGL